MKKRFFLEEVVDYTFRKYDDFRKLSIIFPNRRAGLYFQKALSKKIKTHNKTVCMGWTHIQAAEPTTLGYRFSLYAQDLLLDIKNIEFILNNIVLGKGIKGAVGTSASYKRLLGKNTRNFENDVMKNLDVKALVFGHASIVSGTQVYNISITSQ